ncbi:MAG TPA: hypothetical protein VK550_36180, partial [Polyangiaceae bacterium]|nr:hypothetical protein [Polyangiaceae bacterium]
MKQKTGVFTALAATLLLGTMVGVGCGGDDDTTSTSTGGSGGSGGTTGGSGGKGGAAGSTAGTGGTGGTTDAGGKGGTAGADAATTIPCGTSMCGPVVTGNALLGTLAPCCPMDVPNACGGTAAILMGACLTKTPGMSDSSCPT